MNVFFSARVRFLLAALLPVVLAAARFAPAAEHETPAAVRQYAAAARLQNLKSYDLAADAWLRFLQEFKSDPRAGEARYNLGVCYYLDNKLDRAVTTFQSVVRDYPKIDKLQEAYLYLGAAQYAIAQAGKPETADEAIQTFDTLLAKFPQGTFVPDALYYRGECLYLRGKKTEAIQSYRQLIDKHRGHALVPEAMYALGVCQEEMGQQEEAGKTYEAFLKAFPQNPLAPEVTLRRAETLLATRQFEEAAKGFAQAAAASGFALASHAALRQADCRAQLKQYPEAAALYEAVVSKYPESAEAPRAAVAAGKCYYLADKHDEARRLLAKTLAAGGPASYEAAHWIARSWLKQGQPAKALEVVEGVLAKAMADKSPLAAQLAMDRADAVYELPDRKGESIGLYASAAEQYPDDPVAPQALYMAGFAALEQGQTAQALRHAQTFLARYAEHELGADVLHIEAESHLLLGQLAEAEAEYRQLLERYPNHAQAELWRVRRGLAFSLQKKYRECIDALKPAVSQIRRPELAAEAWHLIGTAQSELGDHLAAVAALEAALSAQPQWRQADETLLALGRAYRGLENVEKAKAAVSRLLADFPQSRLADQAYYRLGEYSYLGGDFSGAAAAYQRVIDGWPQSSLAPFARHELACAQMELGDNAAAEQTLTALMESNPKHELAATARLTRGMARHRLGKFAPAVEDLQAFLATNPPQNEKADARYLLGLCQVGLNQHGPAAATFQALLKDDPGYANADNTLYQMAWALKLAGDEAEAAKSFQDLATRYPQSPRAAEALYHVGEFMYAEKNYGRAAVAYYNAMQKAGKSELHEKAAHKLGWCYFHQGQFDNAQKTFRYQLASYPEGALAPDASFMEGECFFKQDKFAEALAAFERAKNLANPDFQVLRGLHAAQAAAQLKQWQKSVDLLGQCADQFPNSPYIPQVLYEQGWALQNLGNFQQALKLYEQVIARTDAEVAARAQFMIGEIQFGQKDFKEAVKSYFKVMYGYSFPTWQSEATFEAARCFEMLEKLDQAAKLYQELLEKFPQCARASAAKQRAQELKSRG